MSYSTPSSSALSATIKGSTEPGYIYAWPAQNGKVSMTPVVSQISDLMLDFSANFPGSDSRLLVTDPSFSAAFLDVSPSYQVTETAHIEVPGIGAACWSAYAPRFNSAYVINAGFTNITIHDPATGNIKGVINFDASAKGGLDTAIDRIYMYVAGGDASIILIDLSGSNSGKLPHQIQDLDLSALGNRRGWQGMAVYPQ